MLKPLALALVLCNGWLPPAEAKYGKGAEWMQKDVEHDWYGHKRKTPSLHGGQTVEVDDGREGRSVQWPHDWQPPWPAAAEEEQGMTAFLRKSASRDVLGVPLGALFVLVLAIVSLIILYLMRQRGDAESTEDERRLGGRLGVTGTGTQANQNWRRTAHWHERRIGDNNARSVTRISEPEDVTVPEPEPPPPAEEFIQSQGDDVAPSTSEQLSGKWRGFVEQYHRSTMSLCEIFLVFEGGHVRGEGVDDVGGFTITGLSSEDCRRIALSKQYIPESKASNGEVNYDENLGHVVEYRGVAAGPLLSTSGLRGTWHIQTDQYTGQGVFHIWPVEGLHSDVAMEASKDFMRKRGIKFEVSAENVCVICFDNTIDVVLDPCGHIVVCASCAQSLNPRRCPICRSQIHQILSAKGAAMSNAGSSEEP